MSGRKKRVGEEDLGYKVPAEGPAVFQAPKRSRPHALIKVKPLPGHAEFITVRWPGATARAQTGEEKKIEREIIYMDGRPKVHVTYPDPYLDAEARVERETAE
jgi:hypothetical protein